MSSLIDNKEQKIERLSKTNGKTLDNRVYNIVIGSTVLIGIVLNVIMAVSMPQEVIDFFLTQENAILVLLIGFILLSILFVFIIYKSDNPVISFLGYIGLVATFGLLLSITVSGYSPKIVQEAFILTAFVVVIMTIVSAIFPNVFLGLGKTLFVALLATLLVEIVYTLTTRDFSTKVFDGIFVAIFSLYIAYDWQKAQQYPHTMDNAIDSAADIYVDVINLFIRILSILGKSIKSIY